MNIDPPFCSHTLCHNYIHVHVELAMQAAATCQFLITYCAIIVAVDKMIHCDNL